MRDGSKSASPRALVCAMDRGLSNSLFEHGWAHLFITGSRILKQVKAHLVMSEPLSYDGQLPE